MGARLGATALLLLGLPGTLAGQSMRDFTTARQLHGEDRLVTRLDFAAGTLRLRPGTSRELYRMRLAYDAARYAPVSRFDAGTGEVRLGLASVGGSGIRVSSRSHLEQRASVSLSPAVALSLDLTLGAVEADIELGGLRITDLRLQSGASRTAVAFSRPNGSRCGAAVFEAGAAELTLTGIGNSRCERIVFTGGVGKAVLDLSGAWTTDAELRLKMTVGELALRLPRDVGIRIRMDRFLASFPTEGWTRQGTTYLSSGYARARRHVDIELTTTLGGVSVEWLP